MGRGNRAPVSAYARDLNRFIGIEVRRVRERHKRTQAQLAEALGYRGPQSVSRMEAGLNMISAADLARIARFFGVTVRSLFPRWSVR